MHIFLGAGRFDLPIVPAGWVFSIWGLIYAFVAAISIYALTLACRRNPLTGGLLYYDPPFLPPTFFAVLIISHLFNVAWFYIIEEEFLWAAFGALASIYLTVQICILFSVV